MKEFRITRIGCLAVHLMPWYHGKKLEQAVKRICMDGPAGKKELSAVLKANAEDCGDDPLIGKEPHEKADEIRD